MNPTAQLFWVQRVRTLGAVTPLPPTPSGRGAFFFRVGKNLVLALWFVAPYILKKVADVSVEPLGHLPLARILTILQAPATPYSACLKIETAS